MNRPEPSPHRPPHRRHGAAALIVLLLAALAAAGGLLLWAWFAPEAGWLYPALGGASR